jgi:hypothetical protein
LRSSLARHRQVPGLWADCPSLRRALATKFHFGVFAGAADFISWGAHNAQNLAEKAATGHLIIKRTILNQRPKFNQK